VSFSKTKTHTFFYSFLKQNQMSQNLISATLSAADAAQVHEDLADIKSKLSFLLSIAPSDVQGLVKVGNTFIPFLDLANQTVVNHPEILSGVFDKEEFLRDYALFNSLRSIYNQINELAESIQKTYIAVGSDTMNASLEIYAAVKQNKDKVPGLEFTSSQMAEYFKRTRTVKSTTAQVN